MADEKRRPPHAEFWRQHHIGRLGGAARKNDMGGCGAGQSCNLPACGLDSRAGCPTFAMNRIGVALNIHCAQHGFARRRMKRCGSIPVEIEACCRHNLLPARLCFPATGSFSLKFQPGMPYDTFHKPLRKQRADHRIKFRIVLNCVLEKMSAFVKSTCCVP
jgi:hypothetical protein